MSVGARMFMDVSYTRTQRVPVGITRTVRRLEEELRGLCEAEGTRFAAVSFHSGGFRELPAHGLSTPVGRAGGLDSDKPAAKLFRAITGSFFRKAVLASLFLPWALLRWIWSNSSRWTFDFLSRSEPPVPFQPGDVLLLADASWNYPVWIATAKAKAQGARIVLVMYDLIPLRHPEFCFALVPRIFRLWLDRMLPVADAVICISAATQTDLHSYASDIRTVLPGTGHFRLGSDPVRTPQGDSGVRDSLSQFMAGAPTFAAIGSFEPKKNYGFLLGVFERLWARGVDLRLLIIGRASAECEDFVARITRHPEQGKRLLTLFDASDAEVALTYSGCRALVFPSLAEGFGLPLVEARTRGCLVIASSLPCFAELADEGVRIYPQHSHEALERLVLEHAGTDRRAQVTAMEQFTWADSARQLQARMATLVGAGSHPSGT